MPVGGPLCVNKQICDAGGYHCLLMSLFMKWCLLAKMVQGLKKQGGGLGDGGGVGGEEDALCMHLAQ